ncbi:hypothetical protein ANCDUO_07234 [Ancylostoma duodenale]|uniref:Reverse transcriptase domain-containing protein n=1 Tax=Ancylostoma duodenale TaxID=51022 RepID=A0A0C2GZD4_9BILA|nr:hypothetical protein ANCDUO_07234 [Ancylostoma duodenale]
MAVKVDTGKTMMRIISAYAPQMDCTAEEKDSFYLEQYVHSIEDEEVLLLGGRAHQGSAPSSLLFIFCVDSITRDIQKPQYLLCADDVILATGKMDELQAEVQPWKDRLKCYGLRLNIAKTEYVEQR